MAGELAHEYQEYLARFAAKVGADAEFGSFTKYNGKLIKKLVYEEFELAYRAYSDAVKHYDDSIVRGDTINDIVVKMVRDRSTDLVLESPV